MTIVSLYTKPFAGGKYTIDEQKKLAYEKFKKTNGQADVREEQNQHDKYNGDVRQKQMNHAKVFVPSQARKHLPSAPQAALTQPQLQTCLDHVKSHLDVLSESVNNWIPSSGSSSLQPQFIIRQQNAVFR